ncbi:MAG: phytoene/squalene synthase family protein [Candidatus Omnitrophica bacterium]|nr:phytoene/squalene synthase family protein [Candidatus Omnitrophota bacterium]
MFLDREKKKASYSVYAFCRLLDEAVDYIDINMNSSEGKLENLKIILADTYSGKTIDNPILTEFKETVDKYSIPKLYFDELINGMCLDLVKNRYNNFDDLYDYCYKVAGVVGLIMLHIFGYSDERAKEEAVNLGIAMQLTNILRDIKEDFLRGRIYLPQDELRKFSITERDIEEENLDENFRNLMKFQIERARLYYQRANKGIMFINDKKSRLVGKIMSSLYSSILDEIENNDYDVFSKRIYLGFGKKLYKSFKIILRRG